MERPNISVTTLPPRKSHIKKSPVLKRKSKAIPVSDKVQLEKVLGLSVSSNAALSVHHSAGIVAYPAGCVVVLYNTRKNKQSHIFNQSRKTITCLAISPDGKHLVTGECGHQPAVRVWELEERSQVAEFLAHKFSISCVSFSPNMKYIVSVGNQHDMAVNVWNWKTKTKLAAGKVATKVSGLEFTEDGNSFVTVGNRHVKFWFLDTSKTKVRETIPLSGRSGILGEQKNNHFCGLVIGRGSNTGVTYVVTKSGLLCEFNEKRLLDKWVELRAARAHCMTSDDAYIYVGCSDGIIRVFSADSLHFITSLPKPHYLGVDVAAGQDSSHMRSQPSGVQYPDCIAIGIDTACHKITAVYNDHSVYIWDVTDIRKVGKSRSFLYHSSCIWGLEVYPALDDSYKSSLPPGSFITCSSDDTIRVWNIDSHMTTDVMKRNIYSNELLKVLYTDRDLTNLLDIEFNPAGKTDKTDTQCLEKNGVRCLRVSPDGQLLASGDRQGNIRIHELQFMEEIKMLEAHDSEVLCLEYTRPQTGVRLLSSASRDRLIHVFDMDQNYGLVQTLDDHSSAITSVRFAEQDQQLHMLSCGADKSLLFRTAQTEPDFQFVLNRHLVGKTTLYDMDVDPTKKFVATACQDRHVRIYNIKNGKQKKSYKGSIGDDGTMIKIQLDPSGQYVATSCSDKNLCIVDFFTGELQASMFGHSEVVTGLKFMNDFKHLISVSGDGCIFVWRLSPELTHNIHQRLVTLGKMSQEQLVNEENRGAIIPSTPKVIMSDFDVSENRNLVDDQDFPIFENPAARRQILEQRDSLQNNNAHGAGGGQQEEGYRFSVGQLPAWAKKQVSDEVPKTEEVSVNPTGPRGRWAQRVDNQSVVIKSILDENNLPLSLSDSIDGRRFTVEEQTLSSQLSELNKTMILSNGDNKSTNIPIIADDETNRDDDDDDDEFTFQSAADKRRLWEVDDDTDSPVRLSRITLTRGSDQFAGGGGRVSLAHSLSVESDTEAEEDEQKEIIFYLPSAEGTADPDAMASAFHVFEGDANSYKDESTDHGSNESDTESDPSAPNTPHFPPSESEAEAGFMKNNFDNLGNSPLLMESFDSTLESIEKRFAFNEDPTQASIFNSRHSISSRFLSRAQQQHLRNLALQNSMQKAQGASHAASLEQKKEEIRRAVDLTRQKLQALRSTSEETVGGRPDEQLPQQQQDVIPEKGPRASPYPAPGQPPPRRRRMPDPPSHPPNTRLHTTNTAAASASQEQPLNETGGGSATSRSRSSVGADRSRTRKTADEKSSSTGRHAGSRNSDFPPPSRSRSDYNLTSGSDDSTPGSPAKRAGNPRVTLVRTNSYQRGTQSSKAKTQEYSSSTLPNKRNLKNKSKINATLKSKFKSTPDLANLDVDDDDDLEDFVDLPKPVSKTAEDVPSKDDFKLQKYSRRSMPATKLDRQDPFGLNQLNADDSNTRTSVNTASNNADDRDRLAMPPPPTTKVPALKQDTFHKKSGSKSQSNLTLAEAKAILLGKSSNHSSTDGGKDSGTDTSNSSVSGQVDTPSEAPDAQVEPPNRAPTLSPPPSKWSQPTEEDLDEMPVKERPRRVPFRQPMSMGEGEGDDPREGSPEPEATRRPTFPSNVVVNTSPSVVKSASISNVVKPTTPLQSAIKTTAVERPPSPAKASPQQPRGPSLPTRPSRTHKRGGSADEADSPGSSYAGSDSEHSTSVNPPLQSKSVSDRPRVPENSRAPGPRSPGRPGSPNKTFSLPRDTKSPLSSSDPRFSYGSLDRKGQLPSHAEVRNNDAHVTTRRESGSDNPVDILGNFVVKKGSSNSNSERDSFSPPRRDSRERSGSVISDEEKPSQTVKSRISSWETTHSTPRSPSQSPAPQRRRSASPNKGLGVTKPRAPEGTPTPPRPNNTPLPPPPTAVTSPRLTTQETSPQRATINKDSPVPLAQTTSTRLVPKQKDSSGLVIAPSRNRVEYNFEANTTPVTEREPKEQARTFHNSKPKELPRIPTAHTRGAVSPSVQGGGAMNATFVVSPRGTSQDASSTPLSGISSLRAASRAAAEIKQQQQQQVTRVEEEAGEADHAEAEGDADEEEIRRPDKSRRYPPTSLTASPPRQLKSSPVQLSEPAPAESVLSDVRSPREPDVRFPREPDVRSPREPDVRSPREPDVRSPREPDVRFPREPDVRSPREPDVQSPREPDVRSPREPDVRSPREPEARSPRELPQPAPAASPDRGALSLPLAKQTSNEAFHNADTADEKKCEELIRSLQSTIAQTVAFSKRVDGNLQTRVRQALQEAHVSLGATLDPAATSAPQTPGTPDEDTVQLLKKIKGPLDELLSKFGPL